MSNDPIRDLTGGIIGGATNFTTLTINGMTYVKNPDGSLREATDEEKAALAERQAAKAAAKAARRAERPAVPSISIGDVAGGNIIRVTINKPED